MESPDEVLEKWWNIPENKLELIGGQLIISTLYMGVWRRLDRMPAESG